jgi:16S rRNA G966 N2-methylase RsmD
LEQCSSEQTALYKQQLVERLLPEERKNMVDLTGGFGIDFSFMAKLFAEANYVERDERLCEIAHHNFPLLGLTKAKIHHSSSEEYIDEMDDFDLIYLDPSRRDAIGRKMVALRDCSPDIEALQDKLLSHAPLVVVKLSPMLDIQDAIRRLPNVSEVHVVSVDGECKEVLVVLSREKEKERVTCHCINIARKTQTFITDTKKVEPIIAPCPERYLYEPNASILKAGVQDALCKAYNIKKLHPFSHLFTSSHFIEDLPGRTFVIEDYCGFGKKDLKRLLEGLSQGNLTIRNFPSTVAELRKRLKLREGGDHYLFATTLNDGSHALLRCRLPI